MEALGNLFGLQGLDREAETFDALVAAQGLRVERIVSFGQATPEGEWLEQARPEWVAVPQGAALLRFAGEDAPRRMEAGDHVLIAPGRRHRVEWTAAPTVWLAVHFGESAP